MKNFKPAYPNTSLKFDYEAQIKAALKRDRMSRKAVQTSMATMNKKRAHQKPSS